MAEGNGLLSGSVGSLKVEKVNIEKIRGRCVLDALDTASRAKQRRVPGDLALGVRTLASFLGIP